MNIPHQKPIKFAQEVLSVEESTAKVKCIFPSAPTLPMYFEAAAQSSAAFSQDETKIGFLVSVKNVELLNESNDLEIVIEVERVVEFGAICEFSFTVLSYDENKQFAKGTLTVMLQE